MRFEDMLEQVSEVLQHGQRISYRALKRRFNLDDDNIEDLKDELIYAKKPALDEDGRVLVWSGEAATPPVPMSTSAPPAPYKGIPFKRQSYASIEQSRWEAAVPIRRLLIRPPNSEDRNLIVGPPDEL